LLDEGVEKLKHMNLLKDNKVYQNQHPGLKKVPFIYNDYHPKVANGGYVRKKNGTFFNH